MDKFQIKVSINETLQWVYKGISNLKRNFIGIHPFITFFSKTSFYT